jgi:hypothetical protein
MNVLRIMFQNINGLKHLDEGKWASIIEQIKSLQCDIICLSETCINWRSKFIKQQYHQFLSATFKNSSLIVSTIPTTHDRLYLPGGTATVTVGSWNSKIEQQLFDSMNMGRWTGAAYKISTDSRLFVITGYRVCESKVTADKSLSTYAQQYTMLIEKGIEEPNPRKQFCLDLIAFIHNLKLCDNDYLVLAMDANNGNEKELGDVAEILRSCDLVDIYTEKHADYQEFPPHENGSKKIDFMFCTRNLTKYIQKIGYMHYEEGFESDHRAIFCDIPMRY